MLVLAACRGLSGEGEYADRSNHGTAYAVRTKGKGRGWSAFRGNLRRDGRGEADEGTEIR